MSKLRLNGSTSGYAEITAPAVAANNTITLPSQSGSIIVQGNSAVPVVIGSATSTGTASQRLQVTGGAYVSGNLGIGSTNPSNTLVVNGYIETLNSASGSVGLDIGYRKLVSITGNYTANIWYNTGIDRTTDTGIYLLDAYVDTHSSGGQSYQETYVGWFVLPNRGSNSLIANTITTHNAGHAPNNEVVQFRTLRSAGADSKIYLQWLSNFSLTGLDGNYGKCIKIAIHRFGTALNNG